MNDIELLELAAKAAGYSFGCEVDGKFIVYVKDHKHGQMPMRWNPLTDDGEALRLAVKLNIDVLNHESFCGANSGKLDFIVNEDHMSDPLAATRRAIVRAAAEIGKSL